MVQKIIHLVAEGDSWFSFPNNPKSFFFFFSFLWWGKVSSDVLDSFEKLPKNKQSNVKYNLAGGYAFLGDTIEKMVADEKAKGLLAHKLKTENISGMIFSGGGNDLIAKMPSFLNPNGSEDYFEKNELNKILDDIENGYEYFIKLCTNHKAKLIAHTYYPPDPTQGATKVLSFKVKGASIKLALEEKGYTDINEQKNICEVMIFKFKDRLQKIKEKHPSDFYYVDLIDLTIEEKERYDEIHLTNRGCDKVAAKFEEKLNSIFLQE